jgi:hypothetical protein
METLGDAKSSSSEPRIGRRKWLQSLIIGGVVSAFGGAVALVRAGGYDVDVATSARLRVLAPWQYAVVRHIARRMLAADRSDDVPSADDVGVAEFVDAYLADMRPALRRDLLWFLRFVEQLAPFGSASLHRFTALAPADQDEVLSALETSHVDRLRVGFQAIKSLVMMGYYRDPRTFAILGYRGPLLGLSQQGRP